MHADTPIIIAGGGVGGLTAALALHRHGLPVAVYERRTASQIRQAPGSGLTIWSNASTPLGWLGLGDALLARGEEVHQIQNFDPHGRLRFRMSTHRYIWPGALPSLSIGRMDLAEVLMSACGQRGIPVHYGRPVTGFEQRPDGVQVRLGERDEIRGAALIGADGVRSAILTQLHGRVPAIYLGRTTYRGIADGAAGLPRHIPQLFHDPVTGTGGGAYAVCGGRAAWTLSVKAPPGGHDQPGQQRAAAARLASGLPAALGDLIERTPDEAIIRTDVWYHEWHEDWGEGRVTLLGDAAHTLPNDLGQGGCQAVEDAVVLADALAPLAAPDETRPVAAALRDYEARRYPRVKWVREQSVRVATAPELANPAARWAMEKLTRMYLAVAARPMWRRMQRPPTLRVQAPALRVRHPSTPGTPGPPPAARFREPSATPGHSAPPCQGSRP
jgi:2-polyprenyl-6-methoxyphenol hydroxylase-like FAD-dependent oxidoreductase